MATIQMVNDIEHDVRQSGEEVYDAIVTAAHPVIELVAVDHNGEHKIWVNIGQISTFV